MSYLYDELAAKERAAMDAHLQSCVECRSALATWQSATRELNEWKLSPCRKASRPAAVLPWAIAAAFVALAAVGGMRMIALDKQVKELRAEVQRSAGQDMHAALAQVSEQATKAANAEAQSLIAAVVQEWEQKRLADQQAVWSALQRVSARNAQDYVSLRKELETVAVFSEAGLENAQHEISRLAVTPASFSDKQ
jgi:hypothetical protein